MIRIAMYNLHTRLVQFKDQKKLKTYSLVKTELSINENKLNSKNIKSTKGSGNV